MRHHAQTHYNLVNMQRQIITLSMHRLQNHSNVCNDNGLYLKTHYVKIGIFGSWAPPTVVE